MLRRKIEQELMEWRNRKDRKALLIMGARQVGKTTAIRAFGRANYRSFIEINFEERPALRSIFGGDLDGRTLREKISVAGIGAILPGETLLFLDEIQACGRARTAVKFLVEDKTFDIIESGSLLGINYADVSSFPVGFEERIQMHSLDFEEFLWANGVGDDAIAMLSRAFQNVLPLDPFIHTRCMDLFQRYLIVGGMPAAVQTYVELRDLGRTMQVQKQIIAGYRDDIAKYAGKQKALVKAIFDAIPMQLQEKNKKFTLASVEEGARHAKYDDPIEWLADAGVALLCRNVQAVVLPFELNEQRKNFKLFMHDTGLLAAMSYGGIQKDLLDGDLSVNQGAMVENAVAELLYKRGHALHYFDRKGRFEIDFLIRVEEGIVPIEVKSGSDVRRHASLTRLLESESKAVERAYVLSPENVSQEGPITYLPLYMVMFL